MTCDAVRSFIDEELIPASNNIWREGGNHVS